MPIQNFIIYSLNLSEDDIEEINANVIDEKIIIYLKLKDKRSDCEYCGGKLLIKDYREVKIKLADFNTHETLVKVKKRRYVCKGCGKIINEKINIGPRNTNISWALLQAIMSDLKNPNETYTAIASRYHLTAPIIQRYADSFLIVPRQSLSESIGIDEHHSPSLAKRKSEYIGIIVDNVNRDLLEVLPSRSKDELRSYLSNISREERNKVKYVTIDLWKPYRDIASIYLPSAKICADPFHIIKNLSDAFDRYRISIMKQYDDKSLAYYLLKTWRKLLLSDEYDFDPFAKKKFNKRFNQYLNYYDLRHLSLELDCNLKRAYDLKEAFRLFIKETKTDNAKAEFESLLKEFKETDLPIYDEFIALCKEWKEEIINSFERPYDNYKQSNALAENINGRLEGLIIVSNGLTNFKRLKHVLYIFNKRVHYSLSDSFKTNKEIKKNKDKHK